VQPNRRVVRERASRPQASYLAPVIAMEGGNAGNGRERLAQARF
jgi:hypothetical protein